MLGDLTLLHNGMGVELLYFDFGDIPETDEFGNVVGMFSYRNYGMIAGAGVSAASLPLFSGMRFAEYIAFGLSAKLLVVDTLEPGDGSGFATDLSLLIRVDDPWFGEPFLNRFAFGVVAQNLLGMPVSYQSGHTENWVKRISIGVSTEVLEQFVASLEVRSTETVHLGLEWSPVPALALRCGLKRDGVWMWSLGLGISSGRLALDYAFVAHPYLNDQHRASVGVSW